MKSLPAEARIRNVSAKDRCRLCRDDGQVSVGTSEAGTEQSAPCPCCELGFRVEFPESGRGPWGPEGFWQGRDIDDLVPLDREGKPPEPWPIQRARLAELREKIGLAPKGLLDA